MWRKAIVFCFGVCILLSLAAKNGEAKEEKGKYVFPQEYETVHMFIENGKYGFIEKQGNTISPAIWDKVDHFSEGKAVVSLGGKPGYIDKSGNYYGEDGWIATFPYHEGLAVVETEANFLCIDQNYKEVFRFYGTEHPVFEGGYLLAYNENGNYGLLNTAGEVTIPFQWEMWNFFFSEGVAAFEENGRWGVLDGEGRCLIPPIYDSFQTASDGVVLLGENTTYYAFDLQGNMLFFVEQGFIFQFSEGFSLVYRFDENGAMTDAFYVNKRGEKMETDEEVFPLGDFYCGCAMVLFEDGQKGYINTEGKTILRGDYVSIDDFEGGVALVETKDQAYYINPQGGIVAYGRPPYLFHYSSE